MRLRYDENRKNMEENYLQELPLKHAQISEYYRLCGFIDALNWVNSNSSKVGAVSVSRYFNGNKVCSPATTNTAAHGGVKGADATIRSLIANLKSKGIPVFVSTGNKPGTKIDYPACITDTVSVSTGELNSSGVLVSVNALDQNTDYVASSNLYSYQSSVFGLIAQTTSSAITDLKNAGD